jgi:hypothetical protein
MSEVQVTLEQVVELVKTDEGVRNALQSEFLNPETVKSFVATPEGGQAIQSFVDSKVTKGIDTWKNNNLQGLIDKAIIDASPAETPEQKRIKELELSFQAQQEKTAFAEQRAYALNLAQQRGLPTGLIDRFVGKSAEETLYGVNTYESEFKSAVQQSVEALTGGRGRQHLPDNPNVHQHQGAPERKLSQMSLSEQTQLFQVNPQEYNRLASME